MAMQCTNTGWKVYGKASCKKRCTGYVSDEKKTLVDPYTTDIGTGRTYNIKVENLRYTKSVEAYFMGIITACNVNQPGSIAWGKISVTCGDDGKLKYEEEEHDRKGRGFERHYNWGKARHEYKLKPYVEFSDDGYGKRECVKEWKSVPRTGKKYFHCLNTNVTLYEDSVLSPGAYSKNNITVVKGCNRTDGCCYRDDGKCNE